MNNVENKKPYTVIRPADMKKMQDKERIKKEIICISIFIILLGLVLGYWTAFHISAEESEDGTKEEDTTTTDIKDIKESINDINEQIELLNNKIENEVDRLDEENQIINNYLIIQNDLNDIQEQVNQIEEQSVKAEEPEEIEEDIIVDTENRFQQYPLMMVMVFCNIFLIFQRRY